MPKKATPEYWKETIGNIFGNIIDLKYIDYSKNNKFSQKILCNIIDSTHISSELFDEEEKRVAFLVSLNNLTSKSSGCPVCAEKQRRISKRVDEDEIIERIENHNQNHIGPFGKTILIEQYIGRAYKHKFNCGLCGEIFTRRVDDILRLDRCCCCLKCGKGGGYSIKCLRWLESLGIPGLKHIFNGGEHRIKNSKMFADGFVEDPTGKTLGTIFEFNGCLFHGHGCRICKGQETTWYGANLKDLYEKTQRKKAHCLAQGYNYVEIWECEWDARQTDINELIKLSTQIQLF